MSGLSPFQSFSVSLYLRLFSHSNRHHCSIVQKFKKCFAYISGSWKLHQIVYWINLKMIPFCFKCHKKSLNILHSIMAIRCSFFLLVTNLRHTNICHIHTFIQTHILFNTIQFNCERKRFYDCICLFGFQCSMPSLL